MHINNDVQFIFRNYIVSSYSNKIYIGGYCDLYGLNEKDLVFYLNLLHSNYTLKIASSK